MSPQPISLKHLLLLVTILGFLLVPVVLLAAQESDECSANRIVSRIGQVYNTYSNEASGDSDIEASLDSMDTLNAAIEAIYMECEEARYQTYAEEAAALLEDLREGGYVLYVRHAATDRSQEDTDMSSCETQRNLSEQGRLDAAKIGAVWAALEIPVGDLLSTEYCRTRETAELAFGEPDIIPRAELEEILDELLAEIPDEGTNTVIVGHVDLLEAVTGINVPEDVRFNEGDALIYRPLGGPMGDGGYELMGRIGLRNWGDLARITSELATP